MHHLVAERWVHKSETRQGKFEFLKEWAQDESCAKIIMEEQHRRSATSYDDASYVWWTKFDLYAAKGAYHSPEAKS